MTEKTRKVNGISKLRNHVHRSGFDLSEKNAFTAKVGELLPIYTREVLPGDKFKIHPEWFTRTMPVNTAAYTRIKEYVDFFFVPNRILWRYWPNFITNVQVAQSASSRPNGMVPSVVDGTYMPWIDANHLATFVNNMVGVNTVNEVGMRIGQTSAKLFSYLGYNWDMLKNYTTKVPNVKLNPFPLLAYQKIYQDFYRFDQWEKLDPGSFNVDYLDTTTSAGAEIPFLKMWNDKYTGMIKLRYANWKKDMFMGILPSPQYGNTSFAPVDTSVEVATRDSVGSMELVNPTFVGSSSWNGKMATLGEDTHMYSTDSNGTYHPVSEIQSKEAHFRTTGQEYQFSASSKLSILSLRKAECLQRMREITQSNNYDYDSQLDAHFNASPGRALSNMCTFLGGISGNIQIGEVVNNNLAGDTAGLATIQGKGIGSGSGYIDFEAKEHGIIMAIYHAEPLLDYDTNGLNPVTLKANYEDFAIPELDSIGMQEVPTSWLNVYDDTAKSWNFDKTLGWSSRYLDYKTATDKIRGAFTSTLKQWVAPLSNDYFSKYLDASKGKPKSYAFFKVNPSVVDSLFLSAADYTVDTDCLLVNCDFDVKAVRNLSYDGLPY